jgi:hypothetical protein
MIRKPITSIYCTDNIIKIVRSNYQIRRQDGSNENILGQVGAMLRSTGNFFVDCSWITIECVLLPNRPFLGYDGDF